MSTKITCFFVIVQKLSRTGNLTRNHDIGSVELVSLRQCPTKNGDPSPCPTKSDHTEIRTGELRVRASYARTPSATNLELFSGKTGEKRSDFKSEFDRTFAYRPQLSKLSPRELQNLSNFNILPFWQKPEKSSKPVASAPPIITFRTRSPEIPEGLFRFMEVGYKCGISKGICHFALLIFRTENGRAILTSCPFLADSRPISLRFSVISDAVRNVGLLVRNEICQ